MATPCDSNLVSRYLNSSFDTVKYVSDYIPQIVIVSNYIENIVNDFPQIISSLQVAALYLGAKTSDPLVDNNGDPLVVGSMYYNTYSSSLKIWNGSVWTSSDDLTAALNQALAAAQAAQDAVDAANLAISTAVQPNDNVTLGDVIANTVQLLGGTGTQATISWNPDEETLDIIQNGAVLQVGQEIHYHVRNNSGSTIPNGTAVMATGTLGASGRITVAPMIGSVITNAKYFLGVTTEDIENDTDGKVTHFGKVRGIDTTGFNEGDVLWVSTTVTGALTNIEPSSGLRIPVAYCINNTNNGTIFVRANNGHALHEANDVVITNAQDGEVLAWNTANSRWENTRVSYTLSDGTESGSLTVQQAFELEQTKVVYGGNF